MTKTGRWRAWPVVGLVIVIGVAGSVLVVVAFDHHRDVVSGVVQAVTSVLALTGGAVLWLWTHARRDVPAPTDELARAADALAADVRRQWTRAAGERQLLHPAPIPLRWRWSLRRVAGPVDEALGSAYVSRFAALPGMQAVTAAALGDGGIRDLIGIYGALGSGRIIVMGGPGSGKSGAAILALLDALKHRQGLDEVQRAQVPVPVLLTAFGWDPRHQRLSDWLAAQLNAEYPLLCSDSYGRNAANRLIDDGLVALMLDGFDEIAHDMRPVALKALDQQATFRLVVLTRTRELVDAVADGHLHGAAALELLPVSARDAANYLTRCEVQPAPPSWQRLVGHLRAMPESAVTTALDTPLMLTLVRDIFRGPTDVDDLLAAGQFMSQAEVEGYLLERVLPALYRARLGGKPNPYSLDQATRWLGCIATEMNRRNTRDMSWWHIRQWVPATFRITALALPSALGAATSIGPIVGLIFGLRSGITLGLTGGIANGLAVGLAAGLPDGRSSAGSRWLKRQRWSPAVPRGNAATALAAGLAVATVCGIAIGLGSGFTAGIAVALTFGPACGTVEGLLYARRNAGPRRLKQLRWSAIASKGGAAVGLGFGLVFGLVLGLTAGLRFGLLAGFFTGLFAGLAAGLLFVLVNGLVQSSADAASPMDPVTCWRRDRQSGLAEGIAYGLAGALSFGIAGTLAAGLAIGLSVGLINGLGAGLAFTFGVSQSWLATLGFLLLRCAGLFPRHGIGFLEDARDRGVLRTVGSVYQFRHARLQDQLADAYKAWRPLGGAERLKKIRRLVQWRSVRPGTGT